MRIFSRLSNILTGSVGNSMKNDADDIRSTKSNLSRIGYFDENQDDGDDVYNPILTRKLNNGIRGFQRDQGFKIDGIMKPGGETERGVFSALTKRTRETDRFERPDSSTYQTKTAFLALPPLAYQLAMMMGMSAAAAWAWYQTQSYSEQQRMRKKAQKYNNDIDNDAQSENCDDIYARDTKTCNDVTQQKGKRSGAVCHESASGRYSKCLTGRPEREWPPLQK